MEAGVRSRIIRPKSGLAKLGFGDLWRYRELLYFLGLRDVKLRYKQTALGAAWAVLQPVSQMIVFSLLLGRLAGLNNRTGGVPYPLFVFAGLLPWTFFSATITAASGSLISSTNLVTKIYFPRLIVPLAAMSAPMVDAAVSLLVMAGIMLYYHVLPGSGIVWLPLFALGTVLAALGTGTFLCALTVAYRDFKYVVPFMLQLWMFLSPVFYPITLLPAEWRWLLALNPMTGTIEGIRGALFGLPIPWETSLLSLAVAMAMFLGGTLYFRQVERGFADVI